MSIYGSAGLDVPGFGPPAILGSRIAGRALYGSKDGHGANAAEPGLPVRRACGEVGIPLG